jgi:hypothetical protein
MLSYNDLNRQQAEKIILSAQCLYARRFPHENITSASHLQACQALLGMQLIYDTGGPFLGDYTEQQFFDRMVANFSRACSEEKPPGWLS